MTVSFESLPNSAHGGIVAKIGSGHQRPLLFVNLGRSLTLDFAADVNWLICTL